MRAIWKANLIVSSAMLLVFATVYAASGNLPMSYGAAFWATIGVMIFALLLRLAHKDMHGVPAGTFFCMALSAALVSSPAFPHIALYARWSWLVALGIAVWLSRREWGKREDILVAISCGVPFFGVLVGTLAWTYRYVRHARLWLRHRRWTRARQTAP